MKAAAVLSLLSLIGGTVAGAETVTWEALALAGPGRQLLGKGVKAGDGGSPSWLKSLLLDDTFAISAAVHRERALDGFGLSIFRRGDPNGQELESIEFLEDVTLRYLDDMKKPPGTHTHEVTIRKGSVFRLTSPGAK